MANINTKLLKVEKSRHRISVLREAKWELIKLRRQNVVLSAKVEVLDTFTAITQALNRQGGMHSPDVVEALDSIIKEDEEKQVQAPK